MSGRKYYSNEAYYQVQQEKLMLAIVATLCGVGIGALIALIFAPQAGDETRTQIEETLKTVGRDVSGRMDKVKNEVHNRISSRINE